MILAHPNRDRAKVTRMVVKTNRRLDDCDLGPMISGRMTRSSIKRVVALAIQRQVASFNPLLNWETIRVRSVTRHRDGTLSAKVEGILNPSLWDGESINRPSIIHLPAGTTLWHATSSRRAHKIMREGFALKYRKNGNGKMLGAGAYFTTSRREAWEFWAGDHNHGVVLKCKTTKPITLIHLSMNHTQCPFLTEVIERGRKWAGDSVWIIWPAVVRKMFMSRCHGMCSTWPGHGDGGRQVCLWDFDTVETVTIEKTRPVRGSRRTRKLERLDCW